MDINTPYFMMSFRYNKITLEAFGLRRSDKPDIFVCPDDQSEWIRRPLYDFGWGVEYGFVRLPKLDFDGLVALVLHSDMDQNRYGAAAVLQADYPRQLLRYCESVLMDDSKVKDHIAFFKILRLDSPYFYEHLSVGHQALAPSYEDWLPIHQKILPFTNQKKPLWQRCLEKQLKKRGETAK